MDPTITRKIVNFMFTSFLQSIPLLSISHYIIKSQYQFQLNYYLNQARAFLTNDGNFHRHLAKKSRALDCSLSLNVERLCWKKVYYTLAFFNRSTQAVAPVISPPRCAKLSIPGWMKPNPKLTRITTTRFIPKPDFQSAGRL